MLLQM